MQLSFKMVLQLLCQERICLLETLVDPAQLRITSQHFMCLQIRLMLVLHVSYIFSSITVIPHCNSSIRKWRCWRYTKSCQSVQNEPTGSFYRPVGHSQAIVLMTKVKHFKKNRYILCSYPLSFIPKLNQTMKLHRSWSPRKYVPFGKCVIGALLQKLP